MKETQLTKLDLITLDGNLDMSDVLAVVTSKAEERYTTEFAACRAKIKALEDEIKELQAERRALIEKEATEPCKEKVKSLRAVIETLDGTVTLSACDTICDDGLKNARLTANITIKPNGSYHGTSFRVDTKPSKQLLALGEKIAATEKRKGELEHEALEWKRKKSNIPMLERSFRAKIASAKLRTTADGKALLDVLTKDLDAAILALPGC